MGPSRGARGASRILYKNWIPNERWERRHPPPLKGGGLYTEFFNFGLCSTNERINDPIRVRLYFTRAGLASRLPARDPFFFLFFKGGHVPASGLAGSLLMRDEKKKKPRITSYLYQNKLNASFTIDCYRTHGFFDAL
jgi:hypothetical protein